jgi:hypothetical protein
VGELVVAGLLSLLGIRSLAYWWRREFVANSAGERLVHQLFVTARVGTWFVLAGLFVAYAVVDYDPQGLNWYLLLLIGLASIQLLTSFFLSRRPGPPAASGAPPGEEREG